jgi:nitroreductase
MIRDLIEKNRTYRRFYQDQGITMDVLKELVELTRLTSSGRNVQALRYILSNETEMNEKVNQNIKWAGYLKDWDGPEEGEKPSAFVVMLLDNELAKQCYWDHGLAAQSLLLGAVEKGYGGCMFAAIDKKGLIKDLSIDERYEIMMVIALGKPKEIVMLDPMDESGDFKYWRDDDQKHHVPKRKLEELIIE